MTKGGAENLRGRHTEVGMSYQQKGVESSLCYREVKRESRVKERNTCYLLFILFVFSYQKEALACVYSEREATEKESPKTQG